LKNNDYQLTAGPLSSEHLTYSDDKKKPLKSNETKIFCQEIYSHLLMLLFVECAKLVNHNGTIIFTIF